MSAAKLQQHCSHAQEDGLTHPVVQRLAGVGTIQNAHSGFDEILGDKRHPAIDHGAWIPMR